MMKPMMERYILGLDLGTSAIKLVLLDKEGTIIAHSRREYPSLGGIEGKVEQCTEDWIGAMGKAADDLLAVAGEAGLRKVTAIGLSAQMPTMVVLDRKKSPCRNAIVWSDGRAEEEGKRLLALFGSNQHYQRTGVILDGHYIISMYLHERKNDPTFPQEHSIMSAKDYIGFFLTGDLSTDPSTASGYGVYSLQKRTWDADLCRIADVDPSVFPKVVESNAICGRLTAQAAKLLNIPIGTPVITGGADSVCGVLGLGIMRGTICQMWGSSTAILGVTDSVMLAEDRSFFVTPLLLKNAYAVEADLMSTGVSYGWAEQMLKSLGCSESVTELAAKAPVGSDGVIFYPYLAGGEQGVLWDNTLRGTLTGLGVQHGVPHIMRAMLEGMCFESRRCVQAFVDGGCSYTDVLCTGAITSDPFFMQTLSNILGHTCRAMREASGSALGAALLAGAAVGIWSMGELERITHMNGRIYYPNEKDKQLYDRYYKDYIRNSANARLKREDN